MRALAPLAPAAGLVPASASAAPLVTTDPPLQPRFKKSITDYAIHCPDRSLTVTAEGRERTSAIEPGQAAEFTVGYEDSPTTRHSISGRIALLATLMCAATLAVPGPAGALAPRHWSPDVAAARRYLEHRAGNVSFAVRTERRLWGHRRLRVVPAASVLKAMLMVAYLNRREVRDRPLRDRDLRLLRPMIRRSDNVSANYIHNLVGNRGLRRLARRVGMRRFTPVAHPWGHSLVNAADQTRFFLRIDRFVPKRHRRRALRLLHSIVPSQRWGVAQVAPPEWELYFKGGWGSGTGAVDHQVALLRRGRLRVSVAVMTTANGSHAYGKATLRGVFRRLLRGLSGVQ